MIAVRIEEASNDLNRRLPGFAISRDRHYQLSNRVAFTWRIASLGLPVVLLFLGFTGDEGLRPEGREPFVDDADWHAAFADYMVGSVPIEALDRWIEFESGGRMLISSRSLPVIEQSPPAARKLDEWRGASY